MKISVTKMCCQNIHFCTLWCQYVPHEPLYTVQDILLENIIICPWQFRRANQRSAGNWRPLRLLFKISSLVLLTYEKITSYPPDSCVPGCREAEGRGRKQDGRDLSTWLGHGEKQKRIGSPRSRSDLGLHEARHA